MAQADGVVANGTGAAVRADINDQLAAVFTNHSGSSEPGTTYAYQWWADTNANVLKIRNSANNAWITLRELDGTMLIEDGSASTPGLAFADDVNTGIFSPAADQIGFATGGAERLEIGSSEVVFNDPSNDVDFRVESNGNTHMLFVDAGNNRIGIGTSSAASTLHTSGSSDQTVTIQTTTAGADSRINFRNSGGTDAGGIHYIHNGNHLTFNTGGSLAEQARIDGSGRLLVGDSSSHGNGIAQFNANTDSSTGEGIILLSKGDAATAGQSLGQIKFTNSTGNQAAFITGEADTGWGGSGSSDYPGRLVFSTTADGGSSPTERLRITSSGNVGIGESSPDRLLHLKAASSTAYSGGSDSADYNFLKIENTTDDKSAGIFFQIGGNGEAAITATEVSDGATDIAFQNRGGGVRSEKMRIDSSGNLGIGTTSPVGKTYISGPNVSTFGVAADAALNLAAASGALVNRVVNLNFAVVDSATNAAAAIGMKYTSQSGFGKGDLIFGTRDVTTDTAPSERMRIMSDGQLRTLAEQSAFLVSSATGAGTSEYLIGGQYSASSPGLGTNSFRVYTNGNVQNTNNSYGAISDAKLKENIVDASSQWNDIKDIRVRNYNFIEGQTHTQLGVVAQEVETVSPGLVTESPDRDDDGNDLGTVTKSVNYSVLYMKAVKALQEAMNRIETLEAKVAALEAG